MRNVVVCLVLMIGAPVWGEAPPHELVASANKALAKGAYDEALAGYEQAAKSLPDSPELAYNRGVTYYRKGELDKATEQFTKALLTRDLSLEAKVKFNLGNCAYADALKKQSDLKVALERLGLAIGHYKDAIEANPEDRDARANMEMAQLLMKDLLDKQKQEQEKQKPASQPESQPASRPESQPASQPSAENQQKKQAQQQDEQKKDQQAKQEQAGKPDQQEQSKDKQGAQQAVPAELRQMSKEEADKLLQAVRDKEQQRRAEQARLLLVRPVPVEKDW